MRYVKNTLPLAKPERPIPTFYHMSHYVFSLIFQTFDAYRSDDTQQQLCTSLILSTFCFLGRQARAIIYLFFTCVEEETHLGIRFGFILNPFRSETRPSWRDESKSQFTRKKTHKMTIKQMAVVAVLFSYQVRINLVFFPRFVVCLGLGSPDNGNKRVGLRSGEYGGVTP